jgi:hypothetical protein
MNAVRVNKFKTFKFIRWTFGLGLVQANGYQHGGLLILQQVKALTPIIEGNGTDKLFGTKGLDT